MIAYLSKAKAPHKYKILINNRAIKFGADGYSDYTKHKDPERMKRYLARHRPNENWSDKYSAGFWSRWLLWNKPTLKASAADIKKRFRITVVTVQVFKKNGLNRP